MLPVPECCRFRSIAGYRGICLPIFKGKTPASNPLLTTGFAGSGVLPVPECCRFRNQSAACYRKSAVPILTGKEPSSNPVLPTGLPVPECCRFRNRSAAGYKKSAVPILTGKEPSSNPVLGFNSYRGFCPVLPQLFGCRAFSRSVPV